MMLLPEVLIVSSIYDFSTDTVALRLGESGVPFLRLNREQFAEYRFALNPTEGTMRVSGHRVEATVATQNLRSVWFRQPVFLRNTPHVALPPKEQLERSQWTAFSRALCIFDGARWMNHPQATYLAECKPYQLLAAERCGLRVPRTLVGNDADSINTAFGSGLVIKSLDTVLLREGDDCLFTYTSVPDHVELVNHETQTVPLLAQELLANKTDVRVTVIGDVVFAVEILCDGAGIEGDWRVIPKDRLAYESADLPREIVDSCRRLTRELNLAFAAIDLVETPSGYAFIEVNPTGEWGWISRADRAIDIQIAAWLSSGSAA